MTRIWIARAALGAALVLTFSMASAEAAPPRHTGSRANPAGVTSPVAARLGAYTQVSMELDSNNHIHAVASGNTGLWYITDKSGTFQRKRITTAVSRPGSTGRDEQPSLALDSHNHAYVAFVRDDCIDCTPGVPLGVYYMTNKSGSWSTPKKLAGLSMDDPTIQVMAGHIFVSWERCECIPDQPGQVWYGTDASGSWTKTKVSQGGDSPSLALNSNGKPRIAFAQNGIRYAIGANLLGSFSIEKITGTTSHDSRPALAISPSGLARVAWSRFGSSAIRGVYDGRRSAGGTWTTRRLDNGQGSVSIDTNNNSNWSIGVAEDNGGALAMLVTAAGGSDSPVSSSATVDRIDTEMNSHRTVWMYTVTGGDPVGIYYVHT